MRRIQRGSKAHRAPAGLGQISDSCRAAAATAILVKPPTESGMAPEIELMERSMIWREERLPNCSGRNPESEFCQRRSRCRLDSLPSSGGSEPESEFSYRKRFVSSVQLPSSGGMEPESIAIGEAANRSGNRARDLSICKAKNGKIAALGEGIRNLTGEIAVSAGAEGLQPGKITNGIRNGAGQAVVVEKEVQESGRLS
ncbi:hypothetical protein IEQ34_007486 [Dendrobium chrysotoxum]|uniref:Uncharacterized protein n=1 Tax=Dendrobium chrysotoxum TaxID=161865 RepID=A0AAV7H546_DENCH|nr:hypothetical protein IEQ34_007486 [Dendrobium chrysotoxum]